MFRKIPKRLIPVDFSLALAVLLVLVMYTYAKFWVVPYTGFYINNSTARVVTVYTTVDTDAAIQEDDRILSVEDVTWQEFRGNLYQPLFKNVVAGQIVTIVVERDGTITSIEWVIPGWNATEVQGRLLDVWWLAYAFYLAGLATSVLIRPKDLRWWLLLLFYYLTAIWLLVGTVSSHHIWWSALILRATLWLCVPIYIHLHWLFPIPLKKLPVYIWVALYLGGIILTLAEGLSLLPLNAYFVGALVALCATVLIMLLRYRLRPSQRNVLRLLVVTVILAIVPLITIVAIRLTSTQPSIGALALLTLPALPAIYFYTAYRHPVGWLELRANRVVSLYLFLLLLTAPITLIFAFLQNYFSDNSLLFNVLIVLGTVLLTLIGFRPFQRFVEQHLLGIPIRYEEIVEHFTKRIITSMNTQQLMRVLQDEIVPSFLIQQSALLQFSYQGQVEALYVNGVTKADAAIDIDWSTHKDISKGSGLPAHIKEQLSWVHLALPLYIDIEMIGLWLLGKHDPDDEYRPGEVSLLTLLANQISIALTNLRQTEQLQALYKSSIDHQEAEKANLARLLHDEILNNLALLSKTVMETNPHLRLTYESLVSRIRQTIVTLRPTLLDFGLWAALDELLDYLHQLHRKEVDILFTVRDAKFRYPVEVEQHLLRIVQLAVENAIRHAQARVIEVKGELRAEYVQITITDDGTGFELNAPLDLIQLRYNNHFGLSNMYERCELIQAKLQITSEVKQGTAVTVIWNSHAGNE